MSKRRVVVTGVGMITPLGHDVNATWQATLAGKSGVTAIDRFDASDLSVKIYAVVKDFDPTPVFSRKDARKFAPFSAIFIKFIISKEATLC